MRIDWVPYSAAGLVVGAAGLSVGALIMPEPGNPASPLLLGPPDGDRWLALAGLYLLAATGVAFGLPAVISIFERKGSRCAHLAVGALALSCLGVIGYAVLVAVLRVLVLDEVPLVGGLAGLTRDPSLTVLLYGWVSAFAIGEVLLAFALLRAKRISRWVPALLIAHAGLSPLAPLMSRLPAAATALLVMIAFAGVGIAANQRTVPPA